MSYVLRLNAEDLRSIRLHCDIFLGENTPNQIFASPGAAPLWRWLGEGVDPALWAREPIVPALEAPLGHVVEGGGLNATTLLLQRYLCNLLRLGLTDGQHVVEIGAGYGGLAHAVLCARNVRYTIIDLPETLIFSAAFLLQHFPQKRFYVYTPGDDPDAGNGAEIVLLPNYRADWLQPFDVAVNTVSFPEMSREALRAYLAILSERMSSNGFLMSVNYEFNPARKDEFLVADFLAQYFALTPNPRALWPVDTLEDISFRPTVLCTPQPREFGVTLRDVLNNQPMEQRV